MVRFRWSAAASAVCSCLVLSSAPAAAQLTPAPLSAAANLWHLRSELNVAALACRGVDEAALVGGYNQLLADHRAELGDAYEAVIREYPDQAAYDSAMTRLYNGYAQPAAQAALCAHAAAVFATVGSRGAAPLADMVDAALAELAGAPPPPPPVIEVAAMPSAPPVQLALVSIPHLVPEASGDPGH